MGVRVQVLIRFTCLTDFHTIKAMENVRTALKLCYIAQRNFVLLTDDTNLCIRQLRREVSELYGIEDIVEIDLLRCDEDFYRDVTNRMVMLEEGQKPRLHQLILWRNLEHAKLDLNRKNSIVQIFNELDQYDTLRSRSRKADEPFKFGEYMVVKPPLFCVVGVMQAGEALSKLHHQIKDCFWFAQYCGMDGQSNCIQVEDDERSKVLRDRAALQRVFAKPQIRQYICSLLVFTRSHRLCSLAPLTTRPTLRAQEAIMQLAKALVVLQSKQDSELFVTPEYVKVAYRKIGYWLVDWETNELFQDSSCGSDYRRRMELTILTGDWYGSEWESSQEYMESFRSFPDESSTSGFTNLLVEDVLLSVKPPL